MEKLNDIASEVSRLVYAVEGEPVDSEETLLQRVQKYSDEDLTAPQPSRTPPPTRCAPPCKPAMPCWGCWACASTA